MVRKKCAIIVWNKRIKQQVYAIYPAISGGGHCHYNVYTMRVKRVVFSRLRDLRAYIEKGIKIAKNQEKGYTFGEVLLEKGNF